METGAVIGTGSPAVDRLKQIALNMKDYEQLLRIVTDPHNDLQIGEERMSTWSASSLSHGIPGICMLYAELHAHFPEENWDDAGHYYLSILVQHIAQNSIPNPSLFSGAAGIGLAAVCLSQDGKLYHKFIKRINDYLLAYVPPMIEEAQKRETRSGDYDVIEGLSGISSYLLLFPQEEAMRTLLEQTLDYLIGLSDYTEKQGVHVPDWHIPAAYLFSERERQQYPEGNFNLGLSHGIAGPLLILCKAWQQGVRRSGQLEAIQQMGDFLMQFVSKDAGGEMFWKGCIHMDEFCQGFTSEQNDFRRDAWCYGNPGVCVALWYAGETLKIPEWQAFALDTFERTIENIHHIYSPTFCHGFAGIAQIASHLYSLSGRKSLELSIHNLKSIVLELDDPQYVFGFSNLEHFENRGLTAVQYTGLLDGTVGTALTLLHLELGQKTPWQQAFLL